MVISTPNEGSQSELTLEGILHAPSIGYTLVSLGALDTLRYCITIGGSHLEIQLCGGECLACIAWTPGCQEAALTRCTSWRRSGGGVGLGPSGKQLHPATPELTAWQERLADNSQQSAEQTCKRHVIHHVTYLRAVEYPA